MIDHQALAQDYFERARALAGTWSFPEPVFKLRTRWTNSYDELFSGGGEIVDNEIELLHRVRQNGRAVLSSRAGDGKTCMLRRMYVHALDEGMAPIMLDLKKWTPEDHEEWRDWTSKDVADGAEFLVKRFSGIELGLIELDRLPPSVEKILFVDGINEISASVGTQILEVVDTLVRNQMRMSALVADRSVRRPLPSPNRWLIGTILPLVESDLTEYWTTLTDVDQKLLESPFFLDSSLQVGGKTDVLDSRSGSLEKRLGLSEEELDCAAFAAFDAYVASKSRVFDIAKFRGIAGAEVVRKLIAASELVLSSNEHAYFAHHIVHDYLVSRRLASFRIEEWTPELFSDVSFDSASFDSIALAFEQLARVRADAFLRALYDWNLYAAGYALGQVDATNVAATVQMRTIIYAMLAEKRFDPVIATQRRAHDALMLIKFDDVEPFRSAASFPALCNVLADVQSDGGWFEDWRSRFLIGHDEKLGLDILQTLRDEDSVIGWTMANVAKRATIEEDGVSALAAWSHDASATVRWRVAHVLGAFPSKENIDILRGFLDKDPNRNVRYGATRSLVEVAARGGPEIMADVEKTLTECVSTVTAEPRIRQELKDALLLDGNWMPENWLGFATEVIRSYYAVADDVEEQDDWRSCLRGVENEWSRSRTENRSAVS